MTDRFDFHPNAGETEIRLLSGANPLATDSWAVEASDALLPGVDLIQRLIAAGAAIADEQSVLIEHSAMAGLSAKEASALGLPTLAPVVAHIKTRGAFARPEFRAELEWRRPTGQPVVGAQRVGAFLRIGNDWWRLPDALYAIAEAVDALNGAGSDEAARYTALEALREAIPPAEAEGSAHASGLAGSMTIAVADAFSLDLKGEGQATKLVPILHRAGGDADSPLLAPEDQQRFGEDQFNRFGSAKSVYALGKASYVVLAPVLRRALDVVRRTQSASPAAKRALMASPRAALRDSLGDEVDETVIEAVFRDTAAYSDRVIGLGLWQKRVVPWIGISGSDWFADENGASPRQPTGPVEKSGILVGDRRITLAPDESAVLREHVERAMGEGVPSVPWPLGDEMLEVPANHGTLAALQRLDAERTAPRAEGDEAKGPAASSPEVLLICPNEDDVDLEGRFQQRQAPDREQPSCLGTPLKPHQEEGLAWLLGTYRMGRPGVLLADEMGLGKTLQGLAFLAWLRDGMEAGEIPRAPVAVIAPTGLLKNWRAEEERHLKRPGLGQCLEAFGKGLSALKRHQNGDRPALDVTALKEADWVLTTYETLRDYDRDFGTLNFAAMLFDEAQKIKTPGVRITDAAKAMRADFRVALTGTPVENRLADLWCITDAIHPAFLGDLKTFSQDYEQSPEPKRLERLKSSLDSWHGGRPPILLRRLQRDRLQDLSQPQELAIQGPMPTLQREAYDSVLGDVRDEQGTPGAVLKALQRLRAISLHPSPESDQSDEAFINASARCRLAFDALDGIVEARERALIFVDDLTFQARLAGIIQRRYGLKAPPMIINGTVSGASRQAKVDRFQNNMAEFDAMILSPRAGGVGLTLTAANHVIHLSRWWNPAVEDQCTGRVMRIGQTKPVFVHLPLAVLDGDRPSFDQNLDALIRRKRQLFQDALMPPAATDEDRDQLFKATVE